MKKIFGYILGFMAGILNGLFGSGGGVLVVPMLQKLDLEAKKAHATSVAIILPMSIVSAVMYFWSGVEVDVKILLILTASGVVGALIGVRLLKNIRSDILRRIFGLIIIYSAVRRLFF